MKLFTLCSAVAFGLFSPSLSEAQNTGRIECARDDGYVYLYSSMTTLDVRATLPCGAIVQITSRYDVYLGVRTAKGDIGFVPLTSVVVLKDQPGAALPAPSSEPPARERIHYDERPREAPVSAPSLSAFTLLNNTPVRVKLVKTISSATAHVGDAVEFEVLEDIFVQGIPVLTKGSKAAGVIAEAEPKKRFGRAGILAFSITSVRLADGEQAHLRCYQETSGSSNTPSSAVVPLASGKDVAILQDAQFTALVDGDVPLKREAFATPKDDSTTAPAPPAQTPQPKH
ncbi:MAG TPA: hypothetical protein VJY15_22515 [Candidatus Acidoferrum sp.]|nr:hypothetical protein [Candidatus Acidoferrum sp.]